MSVLFCWGLSGTLAGGMLFLLLRWWEPVTRRCFSSLWHKRLYVLLLLLPCVAPAGILLAGLPAARMGQGFSPGPWQPLAVLPAALDIQPVQGGAAGLAVRRVAVVLPVVWLMGAIYRLGVVLAKNNRFRRALLGQSRPEQAGEAADCYRAVHKRLGIKRPPALLVSPTAPSPLLTGGIRPVLVLPDLEWRKGELAFALEHELTHYKGGDLWLKWAAALLTELYWFNPLLRLTAHRLDYWLELACDEKVAQKLSFAERAAYGRAILEILIRSGSGISGIRAALCGNKYEMKERLWFMLHLKKTSRPRRMLSVLVLTVLCALGLALGAEAYSRTTPLQANKQQTEEVFSLLPPVEGGVVTAGMDSYPGHLGMDFVSEKKAVLSAAAGQVTVAGQDEAYGKFLVVDHGNGYQTLYAHCKTLLAREGDEVRAGQQIAVMGATGQVTGEHLHFELLQEGETLNPADYLE